jgi:hypothetical protein
MQIQINTANNVPGRATLVEQLEVTVRDRLSRFEDRLTRVELHLTDENAERQAGPDMRCVVEARPAGMDPITVTELAGSIDQAASGALGKLVSALERSYGRTTSRKGH